MAPLRTSARSRHRTPVAATGLLLATLLVVTSACSSSGDEGADGATTTTTAVGATTSTGSATPGTGAPSTTADGGGAGGGGGGQVTSPSTLPDYDGPCAALADTYGLDSIQPKSTASWVDERQRIVVDAQREAALLGRAQQGAPADVAAELATMATYASWLATTVEGAESSSAAISALGAYPDQVRVSLAVASVGTWRRANCPD